MTKKVVKILKNLPDCKPVAQAIIIERQQKRIDELESLLKVYEDRHYSNVDRIDELESLLREANVYINKTWLIPSDEFDEKIQQILKGGNDE